MDAKPLRALAWTAVVLGTLALIYAPFHAAAYLATPEGDEPPLFPWDVAFREALPGAFSFGTPEEVYLTYGKVGTVAFVGGVAFVLALHARQRPALGRAGRVGYGILLPGVSLFALGAFVAFYTPFLEPGFLFLIVPGMLASIVGGVVYGVATIRAKVAPAAIGWLLVAGGLGQIPLAVVLGHNPIGMSPTFVAWVATGVWILRGPAA